MLSWLAAVLVGLLVAGLQYAWRESSAGSRVLAPALLRASAVALITALLLDAPIGRRPAPPALVALDASASWRRAGGDSLWLLAAAQASRAGGDSVLLVGDSLRVGSPPPRPTDRASRIRPAVDRALAEGRPLLLITDGEIDDPEAVDALPAGSRVHVVARPERADAALRSLDVPSALVAGDTAEVGAVVMATAQTSAESLVVWLGDAVVGRAAVPPLAAGGETRVTVPVRVPTTEGNAVLRAVLRGTDAEPRNDTLAAGVTVTRAAGAVFVSTSPDYDARYAMAVLRGTLDLPAQGFFEVAPGQWRREGTLGPVAESEVRRALREAPVAILHGDTLRFGNPRAATTGSLALLAPPGSATGEWYPASAPPSPVSGALAGLPWDSLPPLDVAPGLRGEWAALETRRARGPGERVAIVGREGDRRVVVVGASGFWRWQFRGGAGADAFAAVWGSIFDWLAAERTGPRAVAPVSGVIRSGEPVRWRRGPATDSVVVLALRRAGDAAAVDSMMLRFPSGATIAESEPLDPGVYEVTGVQAPGLLAVSASAEWLPRRPSVDARVATGTGRADLRIGARAAGWPFVVALLLLVGEWVVRRRLGLR